MNCWLLKGIKWHWILCSGCPKSYKISLLAGIYLLKVKNRSTRTRCEICSKLTIKATEARYLRRPGVFIVNFEHVIVGWPQLFWSLFFPKVYSNAQVESTKWRTIIISTTNMVLQDFNLKDKSNHIFIESFRLHVTFVAVSFKHIYPTMTELIL